MKLTYSKYFLAAKNEAKSQTGALLKISEGSSWGVADLCPKPYLGDASLEEELTRGGALFDRALILAKEDLAARKNKVSLLKNKALRNNYLLTDYENVEIDEAYSGVSIKIKTDRQIEKISRKLNAVNIDCKLRLDFNCSLSVAEFDFFLNLLTPALKNKIEYIEDPTSICADWKRWNQIVPLAFDLQPGVYDPVFATYRIIKPAREAIPELQSHFTLTSAMDHPVGVAHGLRLAQDRALNDSGFLTLPLFEDLGFDKYFEQKDNFLNFSQLALADTGIGMSDELNKLKWTAL